MWPIPVTLAARRHCRPDPVKVPSRAAPIRLKVARNVDRPSWHLFEKLVGATSLDGERHEALIIGDRVRHVARLHGVLAERVVCQVSFASGCWGSSVVDIVLPGTTVPTVMVSSSGVNSMTIFGGPAS